jgi:hypothetical protein
MFSYIKNLRILHTHKHTQVPKLISEFIKIPEYKVSTEKSILCLYNSNRQLETEMK